MTKSNIVEKTLDTLLEIVEVEFKIPLGFAEIKLPVTAHAKKWWKNKKSRLEVEHAIRRAEEKFVAAHPESKVAQMLHEFPLHAEEEFRQVIAGILSHLDEEKITWLAEVQLAKTWGNIVKAEEIRKALELYLPYLRHELNGIKEFREVISALTLERIEETTGRIDKRTERIEGKLDEALKLTKKDATPAQLNTGWFYGHRYGDLATFTGRAAEFEMLDKWLANKDESLLVLRALGGFGKSALTWHWFNNRVDRTQWQMAVWWSFYEKESGFESFLAETLNHLGVEVKASTRLQVNDLLEAMRGTNILIVLDGFERLLRQYGRMDAALQSDDEDVDIDPSQRDCSSLLTETFLRGLSGAGAKSKVLMTTRLCPRALESADGKLLKGCREEPLSAFSPDDAVTYFHNEGVAATRAEIIEVCSTYGYHPLSLSLLVGLINEDHEHRGDIAAVKNLEIFDNVKARRHHVLERAYGSLAPERRDLLSRISCFRGSMEYAVLKKVFPSADLDKALLDLRKRGLLGYAGETGRYDMHPIVRHYAYDHLTTAKRKNVHRRLAKYFDAVPKPEKVRTLEDLAPVIELYHHTVRAGKLGEAVTLFHTHLHEQMYFLFGAYQLYAELLIDLFLTRKSTPSRSKGEYIPPWVLNSLANAYALSGYSRYAIPLFEKFISIAEKGDSKSNISTGLGNLAFDYIRIGALEKAEHSLRKRIDLCDEIKDDFQKAIGHQELGRTLLYRGVWQDAKQELDISLELSKKQRQIEMQGISWEYYALRSLLIARDEASNEQSFNNNVREAIDSAMRAIEIADEDTKRGQPHPRDYIRTYWLLGSAYRANNKLTLAEENLSRALNLCRQINLVEMEADILLDIARLRYSQSDFYDAQEKASEALVITERSGYVLQGADVNLFLAQYALEQKKDKVKAKEYAEEAKRLATCDGSPYYYRVAYEEAERMLEQLAG